LSTREEEEANPITEAVEIESAAPRSEAAVSESAIQGFTGFLSERGLIRESLPLLIP